MKKETIRYGALTLVFTNSVVKLMSLVYRSVTVRMIGTEGLGLTEMMMPFYSFLLVIASWGIPLAISNLISVEQSENKAHFILHTGAILLFFNGSIVTIITAICLFLFPHIIFSDSRIIPGFCVLLPSIIVISVFSALRGYFQGNHKSSEIGKSQVTEQTVRMILGITIIFCLLRKNYSLSIILIGFSLSSFVAECCGGLYLWKRFRKSSHFKVRGFQKNLAADMLKKGTPITLSRLMISSTAAIQAIIIPHAMIHQGSSPAEAASFFGIFAGVALTVLHLPSVITGALSTPLIPAIATANAKGNKTLQNHQIEKSIFVTNITAIPVLALLFYYAKEICQILFATPEAGPMLSILCLGGIFLYLQQPIIAILQGMNRFTAIFIHYCIADVLYLTFLYLLGHSAYYSTEAMLILFLADDAVVFTLNYIYLKKITHFGISRLKTYFTPLLGVFAGFTVLIPAEKYIMQTNITEIVTIILSACLFLFIYLLTLYLSGAVNNPTVFFPLKKQKRH